MALGVKTGGRQKGSKNKKSARQEKLKAAAKKAEKVLGVGAFSGDAHDLLTLTYKDTTLPLPTRVDAAKAAIPYEKPRLQSTELKGEGGGPLIVERVFYGQGENPQ